MWLRQVMRIIQSIRILAHSFEFVHNASQQEGICLQMDISVTAQDRALESFTNFMFLAELHLIEWNFNICQRNPTELLWRQQVFSDFYEEADLRARVVTFSLQQLVFLLREGRAMTIKLFQFFWQKKLAEFSSQQATNQYQSTNVRYP